MSLNNEYYPNWNELYELSWQWLMLFLKCKNLEVRAT